ncbi:MAG: nuclear transport factor 2 family protein [Elusimicrobia bacterium]|nr:nuclear transport factor 2 family protein [Elusimicrobiota bacterium]
MKKRYRLMGVVAFVAAATAAIGASSEEAAVRKVLGDYRTAMEARSVEKLAEVVSDGLLVLEGTYKNDGWKDYRDHHIGPEMAEWKEFKVADPKLTKLEVGTDLAYAVQEATYTIVDAKGPVVLLGAETVVLAKEAKGWRIRHLHLSAKRLAPAKPPAEKK